MSLERIPPQNIEAEQSLLGAILIDKDALMKIADMVRPEDFYHDGHRLLYSAMLDLYEKHQPIDILSVTNRLEELKQLEFVGGRAGLIHFSSSVPTASNIVYYAEIVSRKATLRRLLKAAGEITELGYQESEDVEDTLDTAEQKLFNVSQKFLRHVFVPLKQVLHEAFERLEDLHRERGKLRGLPTGYKDLDNLLAGLMPSDLVIVAARPSVGKTSLAIDFARNIAMTHNKNVGIFSLEMSKEQIVDRLLASQAGIDLWKMRTGNLSDQDAFGENDFTRINMAMDALAQAPIYIDDSANANIMDIRTKARRLKAEFGLDMLIIDYLQLMEGRNKQDGRVQEVAEITRALKSIARELNIPVIALSQLSRAVETRVPAIPKLADLRESGTIEQDADVVMFIYRRATDRGLKEVIPEERHIAEIHIAKHRNGPTGKIELFFDDKTTSFHNLDKQHKGLPAMPPSPGIDMMEATF